VLVLEFDYELLSQYLNQKSILHV